MNIYNGFQIRVTVTLCEEKHRQSFVAVKLKI